MFSSIWDLTFFFKLLRKSVPYLFDRNVILLFGHDSIQSYSSESELGVEIILVAYCFLSAFFFIFVPIISIREILFGSSSDSETDFSSYSGVYSIEDPPYLLDACGDELIIWETIDDWKSVWLPVPSFFTKILENWFLSFLCIYYFFFWMAKCSIAFIFAVQLGLITWFIIPSSSNIFMNFD